MKIAILGYGVEGQAAYEYWRNSDHNSNHERNEITICDLNEALVVPSGAAAQLGDDYLANLDRFDVIVRSPHLHPRLIIAANNQATLDAVTSNTNEFLRVCPTPNVIGITGTKGKGTTATLIAKMLEASGKRVHLGGNIGIAALDLLKNDIQPDDCVVLELSSFQLIDLRQSPHIAVCLMVTAEHLDWHEDIEEYIAAKQQLFIHQDEIDIAIYYPANENSVSIADASIGQQLPYLEQPGAYIDNDTIVIDGQAICQTSELQLLGTHNLQNVCAAVTAAWQVTQDATAMRSVLTSFSGLPYRLEFVRELNGVRYYNDSFGTTPETAIVALQAFIAPKIIILGGSDKGASYDELGMVVKDKDVRQVVLIGDQAASIQARLEAVGFDSFVSGGQTMIEIVETARGLAQTGDVILLSTACASFDMFKDYKDRGAQFSQAVQALV